MIRGLPAGNFSGPVGNHGNSNTAFVDVAFGPASLTFEGSGAVKKGRVASPIECRSIVAGKKNQGVFEKAEPLQSGDQDANTLVQVGNHGSVSRTRGPVREITPIAQVGVLRAEFLLVVFHPLVWGLERDMGNGGGEVEKERSILIILNESDRFVEHQFGGILLERKKRITFGIMRVRTFLKLCSRNDQFIVQPVLFLVFPQVFRVERMSLSLAIIAIKKVKSLFIGYAFGQGRSQAPLADNGGFVSHRFQQCANGNGAGEKRTLTLQVGIFHHLGVVPGISPFTPFIIAANAGITGMFPGQEDATRRRTNGRAGIVLSETHSLSGQFVDVGSLDLLLSITAQFPVA